MSTKIKPSYVKRKKKRRLNKGFRLVLVSIILVAFCFLGFQLIKGVVGLFLSNPYEQYEVYDADTKQYGKLKHDSEENKDENYYLSFYYPKFNEDAMNELVEAYSKEHIQVNQNQQEMIHIAIDYDCTKVFDQYISLTFHQKVYDHEHQQLKSESISYNYDLTSETLMKEEDVLRRNYIKHIASLAPELDKSLLKRGNLNQFMIEEEKVTFYFNKDINQNVTLPYRDHQAYIALTNKQIPSFYMQDKIIPNKQQNIDPNKKMIAFTFDDGPASNNTYQIMDEFEKYDGRATFFMLGQNVTYYPNVVKDVYARGHEVATHSFTHSMGIAATGTFSAQEVSDELYNTCDEIYKVTGYDPKYFRPPYGAINDNVLNECGMDIVKWDIDSLDWDNHDPAKMSDIIVKNAKLGYVVVLMHDIHDETVDGVKRALAQLHELGYQFVTVDTLMQYEKEYLTKFNTNPLYNVVIEGNDEA